MKKPLEWRMKELLQSLLVIRDALLSCQMGQWHQMIPLSGQLRALLIERSRSDKKTRTMVPLLRDLAQSNGEKLEIYVMPETDPSQLPIKDGLVCHFSGFPISLQKQLPLQESRSIDSLLKQKVLLINEKLFTVEEIIGWHADKAGGAHFDESLPDEFVDWTSLPELGDSVAKNILCQLGKATYDLGRSFLRKKICFELHLLLVIRDLPKSKPAYLIDALYPDGKMRISISLLQSGGLECSISDGTVSAITVTQTLIEWNRVRHVVFQLELTETLNPLLKILIDGEIFAENVINSSFFISSAFHNYNVFYNRAAKGDPQDFEFGLGELMFLTVESKPIEKAKLELHFEEERLNKNLAIIVFEKSAYGLSPSEERDIKMTGTVTKNNVQSFLDKASGT